MRCLVVFALALFACTPEFEVPARGAPRPLPVAVEPLGSLERAPAVLRFRVEDAEGRSALEDFHLYEGTLGAYHLGRIRRRDPPATLLEREVPILVWVESPDVLAAPLAVLPSGTYALATPELGLLAEAAVESDLVPVVERTWPPPETLAGAGGAVFCGNAAALVEPGSVTLAPTGVAAAVSSGLDEGGAFPECVRLEPADELPAGVPLVPPAVQGGASLAPRMLVVDHGVTPAPSCTPPDLALGPVCATVADDRVELHATGGGALVGIETPRALLGAVTPGRSLVLRELPPASAFRVTGVGFDALGASVRFDRELRTQSARPHVVLNEVMADAAGAEATSEWIELANDGAEAENLDGFVLDDAVEQVPLPAVVLSPGELALVVADGFAPDPELDLLPKPGTKLVVLPRLGRSGLANAGELLRLRDRNGNVISRFPARPAPGPGKSLARRRPEALDAEAFSFAPHASPGASPGAENVVEGD
jgi:hypothetical protein